MNLHQRFAQVSAPQIGDDRISVFFDGTFSTPRLQHPECVAIAPHDGSIWCGTENGQILRIEADGSKIEEIVSTGGFMLGIAFDGDRALYCCDQRHACVFRLDLATRALARFSPPGIRIPNYAVVDPARQCLYVSDSFAFGEAGPGVWRYGLGDGAGGLCWDEPLAFANGMALAHDGNELFVAETFERRVIALRIDANGHFFSKRIVVTDLPGLPDGLALDQAGNLFIGCYEPSRVLRVAKGTDVVDLYADDPTAHTLCHPTNLAFDGAALYTANLGRWHITRIETDTFCHRLGQNGLT